jgi:tetraacyldisaccharide 4'-kinase
MLRSIVIKLLLLPFSLIYGLVVIIRNYMYDKNIMSSTSFSLPVISVGNLSVGGSGKTPHIEYLIRLLKDHINIGTLSRGYKRKTSGYLQIFQNTKPKDSGDEPLQFKRKFPDIMVAVSENRDIGIISMVRDKPDIQTILLDDAFQHRAVSPHLNILLTEYNRPFYDDFFLPSGRLRESRSGYKRADIIVITKCPEQLSTSERDEIIKKIEPQKGQQIFFSKYKYAKPYYLFDPKYTFELNSDFQVLLLSAIANTDYLMQYLEPKVSEIVQMEFPDHYDFSPNDIANMNTYFNRMHKQKKVIITTEKDAMRLNEHKDYLTKNNLPVFVLPIEVEFLNNDKQGFDKNIQNALLEFEA